MSINFIQKSCMPPATQFDRALREVIHQKARQAGISDDSFERKYHNHRLCVCQKYHAGPICRPPKYTIDVVWCIWMIWYKMWHELFDDPWPFVEPEGRPETYIGVPLPEPKGASRATITGPNTRPCESLLIPVPIPFEDQSILERLTQTSGLQLVSQKEIFELAREVREDMLKTMQGLLNSGHLDVDESMTTQHRSIILTWLSCLQVPMLSCLKPFRGMKLLAEPDNITSKGEQTLIHTKDKISGHMHSIEDWEKLVADRAIKGPHSLKTWQNMTVLDDDDNFVTYAEVERRLKEEIERKVTQEPYWKHPDNLGDCLCTLPQIIEYKVQKRVMEILNKAMMEV